MCKLIFFRSVSPRFRRPSHHPAANGGKTPTAFKPEFDHKSSEAAPSTRRASVTLLQQKKLSNEKIADADTKNKVDNSKLLEKRTSVNKAILKSTTGGNDSLQNGHSSPILKSSSKRTDVSSTDESTSANLKEMGSRKSPTSPGKCSEKKSSSVLLPGQTKYAISEGNAKKQSISDGSKTNSEKTLNGKVATKSDKQVSKLVDVPEVTPAEVSAPLEPESVTDVNTSESGNVFARHRSKRRRHKLKQGEEKLTMTSDGNNDGLETKGSESEKEVNGVLPNSKLSISK